MTYEEFSRAAGCVALMVERRRRVAAEVAGLINATSGYILKIQLFKRRTRCSVNVTGQIVDGFDGRRVCAIAYRSRRCYEYPRPVR